MSEDPWLLEHHSRWQTSAGVIREAVGRAGCHVVSIERVIVGQANEVYAVATEEAGDLIVRMAHRPDPKFAAEAAAIAVVRDLGVPAPEVLVLWFPEEDSGPSAVLVERRLPGEMLRDVNGSPPAFRELGALLATVHSVRVARFGNLDAQLCGTHDGYAAWFVDMFLTNHVPDVRRAVAEDEDACVLIDASVARIEGARDVVDTAECRLAHGDVSPTNVLVDGDRVTGIVDWEAVKGAPQANDFAWWQTVGGCPDITPLLEGYTSVLPLDDGFWTMLGLARLRILTTLVGYAAGVGNERTRTSALRALHDELAHPSGRTTLE